MTSVSISFYISFVYCEVSRYTHHDDQPTVSTFFFESSSF
jgi:hypothetical protein